MKTFCSYLAIVLLMQGPTSLFCQAQNEQHLNTIRNPEGNLAVPTGTKITNEGAGPTAVRVVSDQEVGHVLARTPRATTTGNEDLSGNFGPTVRVLPDLFRQRSLSVWELNLDKRIALLNGLSVQDPNQGGNVNHGGDQDKDSTTQKKRRKLPLVLTGLAMVGAGGYLAATADRGEYRSTVHSDLTVGFIRRDPEITKLSTGVSLAALGGIVVVFGLLRH